jgi:hypothetical protein
MKRLLAAIALCAASFPLHARQTAPADVTKPLPPLRDHILDLEKNEKNIEAKQKDYTYHLHLEQQEFDGKGNPKKTTTTDSESLTIDGVRVDRIVARNGKPLTPDEAQKESDKIDKEVAKAKARREKREDKGEATDSRGDQLLTASRPTILADYAGDPAAKTHNSFEVAFRDLVGTVWIDEQDRVLVHVKGHFLKDFKIGGGLVADIKKDSSFEGQFKRINDEVWLPSTFNGQGKVRILLVAGFSGSVHMVASDYRKYRATSTIIGTNGVIGTDGQPATLPLTTAPATPPHR